MPEEACRSFGRWSLVQEEYHERLRGEYGCKGGKIPGDTNLGRVSLLDPIRGIVFNRLIFQIKIDVIKVKRYIVLNKCLQSLIVHR